MDSINTMNTDLTKFPDGFMALMPMLSFLPDEDAKMGLLVGFTFVASMIG